MSMFYGSASDLIRQEEQLLEEAFERRGNGDTSMTDWINETNCNPLSPKHPFVHYYRKRKNLDNTYEFLQVRYDDTRQQYYAKHIIFDKDNEFHPLKFADAQKYTILNIDYDFEWAEKHPREQVHAVLFADLYAKYYSDLLSNAPFGRIPGYNMKGEPVSRKEFCLCTEQELVDYATKIGVELDALIPEGLRNHLDDEHNHEIF